MVNKMHVKSMQDCQHVSDDEFFEDEIFFYSVYILLNQDVTFTWNVIEGIVWPSSV